MPPRAQHLPSDRTHRWTVNLPGPTGNSLIDLAKANRRPISSEIAIAVEEHLKRHRAEMKRGPKLA